MLGDSSFAKQPRFSGAFRGLFAGGGSKVLTKPLAKSHNKDEQQKCARGEGDAISDDWQDLGEELRVQGFICPVCHHRSASAEDLLSHHQHEHSLLEVEWTQEEPEVESEVDVLRRKVEAQQQDIDRAATATALAARSISQQASRTTHNFEKAKYYEGELRQQKHRQQKQQHKIAEVQRQLGIKIAEVQIAEVHQKQLEEQLGIKMAEVHRLKFASSKLTRSPFDFPQYWTMKSDMVEPTNWHPTSFFMRRKMEFMLRQTLFNGHGDGCQGNKSA
jgi:hypothetical protein